MAWRQELDLDCRFLAIKIIRGGCKKLSTIYSGCKISAKCTHCWICHPYQPWLQKYTEKNILSDVPALSTIVTKKYKKNTQCWIFHHYQPGLLKLDNTKRSLLNFSLVSIMDAKKYNSKKKHNNKNRNMQNNTHCHSSPHGRSLVPIARPVQSP